MDHESDRSSPEYLKELSHSISQNIDQAIKDFSEINNQTKILSLNATIEASRAGSVGRSFAVVANEMKEMANKTGGVATSLEKNVKQSVSDLEDLSRNMAVNVKGTRLKDLALTNIDLIDRNLFERSCDVRWWSADQSLIDALSSDEQELRDHACERMAIILGAYTVYYDIVLCDTKGNIIANGMKDTYSSIGMNCQHEAWFSESIHSGSGNEFGFKTVHSSPLVDNKLILAYSSSIRKGDFESGEIVGVIGILFDWESLAQDVVKKTPIDASDTATTRVCITDRSGLILADTEEKLLNDHLNFNEFSQMIQEKSNYKVVKMDNQTYLVAHAFAPGYEDYTTGWHSFIIQKIKLND